jgi:FkbM family methyltransferase
MQIVKQNELFSLLLSRLTWQPRIIEVGGFTGNHTVKFITHKPDAEIHVFEPVPSLFETLKKNTSQFSSISCYQYAVSDQNGVKTLFLAHHPKKPDLISPASSLHKPHKRTEFSPMMYTKTMDVSCMTLDFWRKTYLIQMPIDLLWIDAQGHEFHILQGAKALLPFVSYIHVEVHFNQAYQQCTDYTTIISFLQTHNFIEVARDFSETEHWFFGNILFERKLEISCLKEKRI